MIAVRAVLSHHGAVAWSLGGAAVSVARKLRHLERDAYPGLFHLDSHPADPIEQACQEIATGRITSLNRELGNGWRVHLEQAPEVSR